MNKEFWQKILQFADRWWYGPLLGFLAAIDYFVLFIPMDALVFAASALRPKRWLSIGFCTGIGSTLGALTLAIFLKKYGITFLMHLFPWITHSHAWYFSMNFMAKYGNWAVWLIAVGPFLQHPMIALAMAGKVPLPRLFFLVLAGRIPKYLIYAYVSGSMPGLLQRFQKRRDG